MSTRAIAPVVGVDQRNVSRDLQQVRQTASPVPTAPSVATREGVIIAEGRHIDATTGEIITNPTKVTGLDGKTYTRAETESDARARMGTPKRCNRFDQAIRSRPRAHRSTPAAMTATGALCVGANRAC